MESLNNFPHEYKLIGKDGVAYHSKSKGKLGGHKGLKIYGKLDCPSALRYIAAGGYTKYRVFFADEETALAAGYRPCGICMKNHYKLWKGGKLMTYALGVSPILNESVVCKIRLANGETRCLAVEKLKGTPILEKLRDGAEACKMKIQGDNCVVSVTGADFQWGYTIVWNYVQDKIVHVTNTPFVVASFIYESQVVNMYLVQYWGHPAELRYSAAPLELIAPAFEPDTLPLAISPDESVKSSASCEIYEKGGKLLFRAGGQETHVENPINC